MKCAACLALIALAACGGPSFSREPGEEQIPSVPVPPTPIAAEDYTIDGPFTHENLAVFLVRKKDAPQGDENYLTLEEGLKAGSLKVTEKSGGAQVNKLEVENTGDRPVYLQAGDTVKGGQQDRTIAVDFVLKPKSGKTMVDAFCVEPGRWIHRSMGGLELRASVAAFEVAPAPLATKEQKLAVKGSKSQAEVWEAGRTANVQLALRAQTFHVEDSHVLAVEDPKVKEKTEAYVKALAGAIEGREDLVGMAFAINGEPSTVEIYATKDLFLRLWPKLLRGAAVEALAKQPEKPVERPVKAADIEALFEEAGRDEGRLQTLSGEIKMKAYNGKSVALFDTEREGRLLHRQIIKR